MRIIFMLALIFNSNGGALATIVQECSGIKPPVRVQINDCLGPKCVVYNGEEAVARITVDLKDNVNVLTPQVFFNFGPLGWTLFDLLPDYIGCNNLELNRCPLEVGERITYRLVIPMNYPSITVSLQIKLNNGPKSNTISTLACFEFVVQVKKKKKHHLRHLSGSNLKHPMY